ncbi:MAG: hypothetical protein HXY37_11455 [Chloroflexi bacterium]|nr:hypothetical protein [Chloroflexota bacterium]
MSHHGHELAEGAAAESVAAGYELADVRARPLWISIAVIFALLAFAYVVITVLVFAVGEPLRDPTYAVDVTSPQVPVGPLVEANPNVDGRRIVNEATEHLESYGWVSQRQGIVHIPIERSMELLLEQGVNPFGQ